MKVVRHIAFGLQIAAIAGLMHVAGVGTSVSPAAQGRSQETPAVEAVPGELLVQFRPNASASAKARARGRVGATADEVIVAANRRTDGKGDLELVRVPPGRAIADAARDIEADPAVEFAEPNFIYTHTAASNDPYYTNGSLWGMQGDASQPANQYGSQAAEAWANGSTGSRSVYIGVIDEGIQHTHPDLSANVWVNPFDPVNGLDDDGNGYVDDRHGWDFDGGNNSVYDGGTKGNLDDHGTHVAGTIGGVGGNGQGIAGVNWQVTMISAKFLGRRGGTTSNAIKAVDYLTDLKTRHGLNIVATSNSWGGGGFSQALLDAIVRAAKEQILFVAAAGNGGSDGVGDNNDVTPHYPSNYNTTAGAGWDAVISVASITSSGARSSFSNYGATTVDIGAPGSGIWSTTASNTYSSYSGTSMATPHVSGAAALYAARYPTITGAALRTAILNAAQPTASLSGKTSTGGRLNAGGF